MNLNLKFSALSIEEIEKTKGLPIENCVADTTVSTLALFLQKGLLDNNNRIGVSKTVALGTIDEYVKDKDKDELLFDIVDALVDQGFLSRGLDVAQLRTMKAERLKSANETLREASTNIGNL